LHDAPNDIKRSAFPALVNAIKDDLQQELKAVDLNKDGKICKEELDQWLSSRYRLEANLPNLFPDVDVAVAGGRDALVPPTSLQLRRLAVQSGLPFVGFGFLDNFIMLVAGSELEAHLGTLFGALPCYESFARSVRCGAGATLGLSALACAALGNTISDVAGIKAGGVVETIAEKCGLPDSGLSVEQLGLRNAKLVRIWSSVFGITIGCLLGMIPLLWIDEEATENAPVRTAFAEIDSDANGLIDLDELTHLIRKLGLPSDPSRSQLTALCEMSHANSAQGISVGQAVKVVNGWKDLQHKD
jgi:Ca2+-binding EF-hand superfamily protein